MAARSNRRTQRLLSSSQFRLVYERGQKMSTPFFSAFILRTDKETQRLGLTATRKIGSAVVRNRCRRRLREIFRLRDRSLLAGVGLDIVLNVRSNVATADSQEIAAAFAQMMQRFQRLLDKQIEAKGEG